MSIASKQSLGWFLIVAVAAHAALYHDTYASIVRKWNGDTAFSHGFLVLPVSLWLAWRKREELLATEWRPSWIGVAVLFWLAAIWVVSRGTGILVFEQLSVVAMVPALALAILGPHATRVLLFPLGFLLFMVPFGRGLVPLLMEATASAATLGLRWSGVPVFRSHMYLSIPAGSFEIARACSGFSYVITGLVIGVLYAHVTYRGWRKRLLCVVAFVLIPVLANGIRVYLTVLVSHLTNMRFGPGAEHVAFGRVLFVVVMMAMFWVGRRWRDAPRQVVVGANAPTRRWAGMPATSWAAIAAAYLLALCPPSVLAAQLSRMEAGLGDPAQLIALPSGAGGWSASRSGAGTWRPFYRGALVEATAEFGYNGEPPVEVSIAVYGLGATLGSEMIAYGNVISQSDYETLRNERRRLVSLPGRGALAVWELRVDDPSGHRLVWYWYLVGQQPVTSRFAVKALEAIAFATGRAESERIVALATYLDPGAEERLGAFVAAHAACVMKGFATEACGG